VAELILEAVRKRLREAGIVGSDREFCELWLGKSECYMRALRFNDIAPSADALATCAARLAWTARELRRRGKDRQLAWADELEQLRVQCYTSMDELALSKLQRKGVCA
jgi:hypothetical protein